MGKNLLVFIDSLGHFNLENMKFPASLNNCKAKLRPGFGYSINVKAEIFGGYCPGRLGYLNEWTYRPESPLRKYQSLFRMLATLKNFYYPDRIAHKLISKSIGYNILNIPFKYLPFFEKVGTEPYRDEFVLPTIFSRMSDLKKICYYHYRHGQDRDFRIFTDTMKALSEGTNENIFAAFGDLDGITHEYGVGSKEFHDKIGEMDNYLCQLYRKFSKKNPEGSFTVISDHGMANINRTVCIDMEKNCGRAGEDTYLYFIDSTMLRVWIFNKNTKDKIENYLKGLNFGKTLTSEQRISYGIDPVEFGNILFLLNEGVVFTPGFFGRKTPKAMHGYRPELQSQKGLIVSTAKCDSDELSALAAFSWMEKVLT